MQSTSPSEIVGPSDGPGAALARWTPQSRIARISGSQVRSPGWVRVPTWAYRLDVVWAGRAEIMGHAKLLCPAE